MTSGCTAGIASGSRSARSLAQGRPVLAEEALRIGLVSAVVSMDALRCSRLAYPSAKQAMRRGLESSMDAEWQANLSTQAILLSSNDFRVGLAAVTEKRSRLFMNQ